MDCADETHHRDETYNRELQPCITFRKGRFGWTAFVGDHNVGSIDRAQCRVTYLDVHPMHRLQGIGTTLLFLALEDMRATGCEAATVHPGRIRPSDPHPQKFYEKQGFVVSMPRDPYAETFYEYERKGLGVKMKKDLK